MHIYIHVCIYIYIYIYIYTIMYIYIYMYSGAIGRTQVRESSTAHGACTCNTHPFVHIRMGWLWLIGSIKLQVCFAKEPYKRDDILQKRLII